MAGGGPHPADAALFAPAEGPRLRAAAHELRWLRDRGYSLDAALKLVGDRHQLRDRQRVAISRATSESAGAAARAARRVPEGAPPPGAVLIDAFNVLITVETALRGGVLVTTVDGGLKDLAGIHGTYRAGEATDEALDRVARRLAARGWAAAPARFFIDAPVSNSGRLAARLRARAAAAGLPWTAEVVADPDRDLAAATGDVVVATGDACVLDRCGPWLDLGAEVVRAEVPGAWIVDLVA
ncbi:MAG: DUF434 domain-containing protein [Planctomycetes bacterium]|nr:DUF434 domain-containing protein [Planctomycetota bacterium]